MASLSIKYFTGFETGDASEISGIGTGASVQASTVKTGGYSLKQAATLTVLNQSFNQALIGFRGYFWPTTVPGSARTVFIVGDTTITSRLLVQLNTSAQFRVVDAQANMGLSTTNGVTVLSPGQWYKVEVAFDVAAGGVVKLWLNDNLEINTTHSIGAGANVGYLGVNGVATTNEDFFDDIQVTDVASAPGSGRCIARQGKTGSPTYDAWTKTGAATSALCWSDTPFSATTNCNTVIAAQAQTMLLSSFSSTQAGHGNDTIQSPDTINACKTAVIAKDSLAGNGTIRRRIGGADTDTTISLTTSDKYFDDGIWSASLANLNAGEAGGVSVLTNLTTFEDVWVMVDYTDGIMPRGQL